MLTDKHKKIISLIQDDLPLDPEPFKTLAQQIDISEEELIDTINEMVQKGLIRRFGATLRHQNAGYRFNAMVVWNVKEEDLERVGTLFGSMREVTHCYQRVKSSLWPYNLYTMIHGVSKESCLNIARRMSELSGIRDYQVLFSKREFKKTSMHYF